MSRSLPEQQKDYSLSFRGKQSKGKKSDSFKKRERKRRLFDAIQRKNNSATVKCEQSVVQCSLMEKILVLKREIHYASVIELSWRLMGLHK